MYFIFLVAFGAFLLASVSGFFSVWGLASTFSGIFWSVIAMGVALEYGKLIASSFLYRYWDDIHKPLKIYLMSGVVSLMVLTGLGHFGYLSSGYQSDVLPLKQKQAQVNMLEEEKTRLYDRKKQIDDLLADRGPEIRSIQAADGTVDEKATRALRLTSRNRENMVKQYRSEQADVTARVKAIDDELLPLKQDLIKTEAHTGPITYIAKAFNMDTDSATKYLIFLIILVFDPLAVALTLAANIAIRKREMEILAKKSATPAVYVEKPTAMVEPVIEKPIVTEPVIELEPTKSVVVDDNTPVYTEVDATHWEDDQPENSDMIDPVVDEPVDKEPAIEEPVSAEEAPVIEPPIVEPAALVEPESFVEPTPTVAEQTEPDANSMQPGLPTKRHVRPYANVWDISTNETKIHELLQHYNYLKTKHSKSPLSKDEQWELQAIEEVLRKHGYGLYIN